MENTRQLTSLFNEFTLWSALQIGLIVLLAWLGVVALRRFLPPLAELLPARLRLRIMNAVPILRLILVTVAIFLLVPIVFNVTLKNFVLVLGTLGVALGFALKDYATSAFAGVVSVFERPYRSGDWVRIGAHYGEVISVGTRALRLRTANDDTVVIPHSKLWTESVANANDAADRLMCVADFYIAPDRTTPDLRQLLSRVARTSAYVAYDMPVVVVMRNEPFATRVSLKAYPYEPRDQFRFIADLTCRGRDALLGHGVRIVQAPDFGGDAQ